MLILVDTRQQAGKHDEVHTALRNAGHQLLFVCLPYGDYMNGDMLDDVLKALAGEISAYNCTHTNTTAKGKKRLKTALEALKLHSIDTKQDMQEIYGNMVQSHKRFRAECERAEGRLTILCESGEVMHKQDVHKWKNPRILRYYRNKARGFKVGRPPMTSKNLQNAMETMTEKYGVQWAFARDKEDAARLIIETLQ